jgi:multicomponent Na+:H+ antiporter subunit E
MSALGRITFLTAIWVFLWGSLSPANVISGIAVAVLLLVLNPDPRIRRTSIRHIRPVALAKLGLHIVAQLVVSNAVVAREILTRGSDVHAGIVECRLRVRSPRIVTFIANVLSLSPGIIPVEVNPDVPSIHIHVLHLGDPEESRRRVATLEALTVRAFGGDV